MRLCQLLHLHLPLPSSGMTGSIIIQPHSWKPISGWSCAMINRLMDRDGRYRAQKFIDVGWMMASVKERVLYV